MVNGHTQFTGKSKDSAHNFFTGPFWRRSPFDSSASSIRFQKTRRVTPLPFLYAPFFAAWVCSIAAPLISQNCITMLRVVRYMKTWFARASLGVRSVTCGAIFRGNPSRCHMTVFAGNARLVIHQPRRYRNVSYGSRSFLVRGERIAHAGIFP